MSAALLRADRCNSFTSGGADASGDARAREVEYARSRCPWDARRPGGQAGNPARDSASVSDARPFRSAPSPQRIIAPLPRIAAVAVVGADEDEAGAAVAAAAAARTATTSPLTWFVPAIHRRFRRLEAFSPAHLVGAS